MLFFFDGKPCPKGHVSYRYVSSKRCSTCAKDDGRKKRSREKDGSCRKRSEPLTWDDRIKLEKQVRNVSYKSKNDSDPMFRLVQLSRLDVRSSVGRIKSMAENMTRHGCSMLFLARHIEAQFLPGMSWSNYGDWQIDHITPISTAKTPEDVISLSHFTNLRPVWKSDNRKKSDSREFLI